MSAVLLPVKAAFVTHGALQLSSNLWRAVLHRRHVRWDIVGWYAAASLVVGVTDDLTGRFNAVDLVRVGSQRLGGQGGGGRPDMAQGGGPDGQKADQAVQAVREALLVPA